MPCLAPFALNAKLDESDLRERFSGCGRIQIFDFLEPAAAEALRAELVSSEAWRLVINGGSQVFEIARRDYALLPAEELARIEDAVHAAARDGFQFRYEAIRVADAEAERAKSGTLLDRFASFLSSAPVMEFFHRITGCTAPDFADAQGTRYCAGDFLTGHDDDVADKNRSLAYVLGLTDGWNPDWGGMLHFYGAGGSVDETFAPRFNALSLFRTGQRHAVGIVAPFAGDARLSVTGWLRTGRG